MTAMDGLPAVNEPGDYIGSVSQFNRANPYPSVDRSLTQQLGYRVPATPDGKVDVEAMSPGDLSIMRHMGPEKFERLRQLQAMRSIGSDDSAWDEKDRALMRDYIDRVLPEAMEDERARAAVENEPWYMPIAQAMAAPVTAPAGMLTDLYYGVANTFGGAGTMNQTLGLEGQAPPDPLTYILALKKSWTDGEDRPLSAVYQEKQREAEQREMQSEWLAPTEEIAGLPTTITGMFGKHLLGSGFEAAGKLANRAAGAVIKNAPKMNNLAGKAVAYGAAHAATGGALYGTIRGLSDYYDPATGELRDGWEQAQHGALEASLFPIMVGLSHGAAKVAANMRTPQGKKLTDEVMRFAKEKSKDMPLGALPAEILADPKKYYSVWHNAWVKSGMQASFRNSTPREVIALLAQSGLEGAGFTALDLEFWGDALAGDAGGMLSKFANNAIGMGLLHFGKAVDIRPGQRASMPKLELDYRGEGALPGGKAQERGKVVEIRGPQNKIEPIGEVPLDVRAMGFIPIGEHTPEGARRFAIDARRDLWLEERGGKVEASPELQAMAERMGVSPTDAARHMLVRDALLAGDRLRDMGVPVLADGTRAIEMYRRPTDAADAPTRIQRVVNGNLYERTSLDSTWRKIDWPARPAADPVDAQQLAAINDLARNLMGLDPSAQVRETVLEALRTMMEVPAAKSEGVASALSLLMPEMRPDGTTGPSILMDTVQRLATGVREAAQPKDLDVRQQADQRQRVVDAVLMELAATAAGMKHEALAMGHIAEAREAAGLGVKAERAKGTGENKPKVEPKKKGQDLNAALGGEATPVERPESPGGYGSVGKGKKGSYTPKSADAEVKAKEAKATDAEPVAEGAEVPTPDAAKPKTVTEGYRDLVKRARELGVPAPSRMKMNELREAIRLAEAGKPPIIEGGEASGQALGIVSGDIGKQYKLKPGKAARGAVRFTRDAIAAAADAVSRNYADPLNQSLKRYSDRGEKATRVSEAFQRSTSHSREYEGSWSTKVLEIQQLAKEQRVASELAEPDWSLSNDALEGGGGYSTSKLVSYANGHRDIDPEVSAKARKTLDRYRELGWLVAKEAMDLGLWIEVGKGKWVPFRATEADRRLPRVWSQDGASILDNPTSAEFDTLARSVADIKENGLSVDEARKILKSMQDRITDRVENFVAPEASDAREHAREIKVLPDVIYVDTPTGRKTLHILDSNPFKAAGDIVRRTSARLGYVREFGQRVPAEAVKAHMQQDPTAKAPRPHEAADEMFKEFVEGGGSSTVNAKVLTEMRRVANGLDIQGPGQSPLTYGGSIMRNVVDPAVGLWSAFKLSGVGTAILNYVEPINTLATFGGTRETLKVVLEVDRAIAKGVARRGWEEFDVLRREARKYNAAIMEPFRMPEFRKGDRAADIKELGGWTSIMQRAVNSRNEIVSVVVAGRLMERFSAGEASPTDHIMLEMLQLPRDVQKRIADGKATEADRTMAIQRMPAFTQGTGRTSEMGRLQQFRGFKEAVKFQTFMRNYIRHNLALAKLSTELFDASASTDRKKAISKVLAKSTLNKAAFAWATGWLKAVLSYGMNALGLVDDDEAGEALWNATVGMSLDQLAAQELVGPIVGQFARAGWDTGDGGVIRRGVGAATESIPVFNILFNIAESAPLGGIWEPSGRYTNERWGDRMFSLIRQQVPLINETARLAVDAPPEYRAAVSRYYDWMRDNGKDLGPRSESRSGFTEFTATMRDFIDAFRKAGADGQTLGDTELREMLVDASRLEGVRNWNAVTGSLATKRLLSKLNRQEQAELRDQIGSQNFDILREHDRAVEKWIEWARRRK